MLSGDGCVEVMMCGGDDVQWCSMDGDVWG